MTRDGTLSDRSEMALAGSRGEHLNTMTFPDGDCSWGTHQEGLSGRGDAKSVSYRGEAGSLGMSL